MHYRKNPFSVNNKIIWLIGIFLFALVIRFIYLGQVSDTIWFCNPQLDAAVYDSMAVQVSRGDWIGEEVFFMNPGLSYFLALIYLIFGHNLFVAIVIQFLVGALNCVLLYFIGLRIFDKKTGIIAGLGMSLYGISIFYEGLLLTVTLINFFNLLVLLLLLTALETSKRKYYFLSGIFLGFSALFRLNILLFIPFVLLWLITTDTWKLPKLHNFLLHIKIFGVFVSGVFIVIFPVSLRNYLVSGEFVLTTASGGINFYIGNNPRANGSYAPHDAVLTNPTRVIEYSKQLISGTTGKPVTYKEASSFWFSKALNYIKENPGDWLKLIWRKFALFWNKAEVPLNMCFKIFRKDSWILSLPLFSFNLICPLGLLGMSICTGRGKRFILLFFFVFTYLISNIIFFVLSEYRFPIVPILIIFASCSILWYARQIKEKKWKMLFSSFIPLFGLIFIINFPKPIDIDPYRAAAHYNLGTLYYEHNDFNKSLEEFQKAVDYNSENADIYSNLGNTYLARGDYKEAFKSYKKALSLNPDHAHAHNNLGHLYYINKKYKKAVIEYQMAVKLEPFMPQAHNNLGLLYYDNSEYKKAFPEYQKAIEINTNYFDAHLNLGNLYYYWKNYHKALEEFEIALKLRPGNVSLKKKISLARSIISED